MPKFVLLATDVALYFQLLVLLFYARHALRSPLLALQAPASRRQGR